jgi:hypothetical protein
MFESVLEKFEKYLDKMEAEKPPTFNLELAMEVKKRLEQLDYLYKLVMEKHSRFMNLLWVESRYLESLKKLFRESGGSITVTKSEERIEMDKLIFEIETFTESFYYLAGRMRTILRHASEPLPGLKSFECVGARNVRNKLLEHVEGSDSRVFLQSFGVGGEQGPTLKVERPAGQETIFPDAGLETNATEIKNIFENLLDRALS